MDFKEIIEAEIQTKKRKLAQSTSKYVRRGDLEDSSRPPKEEEEQQTSQEESVPIETREHREPKDIEDHLPAEVNEAIERRLKAKGQPICLFGETDREREERLKVVESKDFLESEKIVRTNVFR